MLKINNELLVEIGLGGLPQQERDSLLKHIYDTLEMRVGMRLADQMTNEQLDEFEKYFEAKDDAGAFKWLESNFPNYKDIVKEEFDKLKAEVAATAPQILAASGGAAAAPTADNTVAQPAATPVTEPATQPVATPQPVAQPAAPIQPAFAPAPTPPAAPEQPTYQPAPAAQPQPVASPTPAEPGQTVFPNEQPPAGPPTPPPAPPMVQG